MLNVERDIIQAVLCPNSLQISMMLSFTLPLSKASTRFTTVDKILGGGMG